MKSPIGQNVLITGGAGTLGRAIIQRATKEGWDCNITIFSTDAGKHAKVRRTWPRVKSVIGDIRDFETLYNAMVGHDTVIHGAAVKFIPESEWNSIDTVAINVVGSQNVCAAAVQAGVERVLAISTDKSCHPGNAYGATKMLMEKIVQEYSRLDVGTKFHLVRYGNVLESTGSVIEAWKRAIANSQPLKITDPQMTRFWMSPGDAVDYVVDALQCPSGSIFVPHMGAMSIENLYSFVLNSVGSYGIYPIERIPIRPGEKIHETLVTLEELSRTASYGQLGEGYIVYPSTVTLQPGELAIHEPLTSANTFVIPFDDMTALLEYKDQSA